MWRGSLSTEVGILGLGNRHIDAKLEKSVQRLVCKERMNISKIFLDGVTINHTIGSLAALSNAIWFGNAVKAHLQGQYLDVHKVFIISRL